jgi:predicted O-methyltransferase YrrM
MTSHRIPDPRSRDPSIFDRLVWGQDRVLLDDIAFRLEDFRDSTWDLGDECFRLYKHKRTVDQYDRFWRSVPAFRPRRIMEIGTFDGGSVAFWNEFFAPDKLVAIDLASRADSSYFRKYVATRGLETKIKTYWNTDQTDVDRLRSIVESEFDGQLDLVIDDASHLYGPTKKTFETLFPRLRPDGLYVIEDWSWGCWPSLPLDFRPHGSELPRLVNELTNAAGSMTPFLVGARGTQTIEPLIAAVQVYPDFVVVERGPAAFPSNDFTLERYTTRRPQPGWWHTARRLIQKVIR